VSDGDAPTEENTTIKASPAPPVEVITTPSTPQRAPVEVKRGSPFDHLFTPPSASDFDASATEETPKSRSTAHGAPPSSFSGSGRHVPSGLSAGPSGPGLGGKDKYGSISRTDHRRLGRHLPRIASGGEGWDGEPSAHTREPSARRIPSTLGRAPVPEPPASPTKDRTPISKPISKKKSVEVLTPSVQDNQVVPPSPTTTTPGKRRSAYMASISKDKIGSVLQSPRHEVQGADMKGLMNAVGSLPARGASKDDSDGVTGKLELLSPEGIS
jgi:Ras GTPase-activating-like protein IQGAP2/3